MIEFHLRLRRTQRLTTSYFPRMDQSEAGLATVEAWWKKSFDISKDNNDPLFSLFTTTFETIMIYLSQSIDYDYMQQSVTSLDEQRKLALLSEDKYDPLRHISFGMIEVVQAILLRDTRKLEEMIKSGYIPVPAIQNLNLSVPLEPKREEINEIDPVLVGNEIITGEDANEHHLIKEEEELEDNVHEELIDKSASIPHDNQITGLDDVGLEDNSNAKEKNEHMDDFVDTFPDEIDSTLAENLMESSGEILNRDDMSLVEDEALAKEDSPKDLSMKDKVEGIEDSSSNLVIERGRKSARRVTHPAKYKNAMDDSDKEEDEPNVKKMRLDSDKKGEKKNNTSLENDVQSESAVKKLSSNARRSDTELECPECKFRTYSVGSWIDHLRQKHSTTPTLAGLVLRCECGYESVSHNHSFQCNISNFTIIRKKDGPIRRLGDVAADQVKCVLCEVFPKTLLGYIKHLNKHHKEKSTLIANGIYLICACGFEIKSNNRHSSQHMKNCEETEFTVHKLKDKVYSTPQCVLCEAYPKTTGGYFDHLKKHKDYSTLQSNGIYLLCACGLEVRTSHGYLNHDKKCNGRQFTLHKVDEEEDISD